MPVYKCKMCGGSLEINTNESTATCEYCGTTQTIPKTDDDIIGNLFNRANTLRLKSEFDKAEEIYNKIITTDNTQAEAYWGIILCKYGIEYVEDPATFTRVPTCHRTSFEAITADEDYKLALQYADTTQKLLYEEEAKAIDEIQKGILAISQNEKPYDVFICYKETDENGKRTNDSVIANDIYHQLTQEGFKVFYAAITLEDKLGQEYEPYIFAALNSAKVMLVIGSKPEYFTAVWVKNEWSRFLKQMKSDRSKLLIPCYKDMDAYELPEEFAHLQAQDMSKIGFINDVVRGIKKVVSKEKKIPPETNNSTAQQVPPTNIAPLLERTFMFLEDEEWNSADEYAEKVLDIDPKCGYAYLCKLMIEIRCSKRDELKNVEKPFDNAKYYEKAIRFGNEELKKELIDTVEYIKERNETARKTTIYNDACSKMNLSKSEDDFKAAADIFKSISGFRDSDELASACIEKAEEVRNRESAEKKRKQEEIQKRIDEIQRKFTITLISSNGQMLSCDMYPYEYISDIKTKSKSYAFVECKKSYTILRKVFCPEDIAEMVIGEGITDISGGCGPRQNNKNGYEYPINRVFPAGIKLTKLTLPSTLVYVTTTAHNKRNGEEENLTVNHLKEILGEYSEVILSEGTKKLHYNILTSCKFGTVKLPKSLQEIDSNALYNCSCLKTVDIPEGSQLKKIGTSAFASCISLSKITFPFGLETVEFGVFAQCESLREVVFPDSVQNFDKSFCALTSPITLIVVPDRFLSSLASSNKYTHFTSKEQMYRNKGVCQHCGGKFKGLLNKVCTLCGRNKDY